ncbi:MAG TPA: DUF6474 family protein [Pseudonocardiaceae bacterium]|nr:DUF6474 family protein [Pseudonocardiaceae bacterium]
MDVAVGWQVDAVGWWLGSGRGWLASGSERPEFPVRARETLAKLAVAVRVAERMPAARRKAAHRAVAAGLDLIEQESLPCGWDRRCPVCGPNHMAEDRASPVDSCHRPRFLATGPIAPFSLWTVVSACPRRAAETRA